MKVLELFKGSGSITNYYKDNKEVEVISLDIVKKYNPTICSDIMNFDYKQFDIGHFDIIWASPECKIFSILQNTWIGRKWKSREHLTEEQKKHSKFINKTIEIIDYLKPKYYFIENPNSSKIWDFIENKNYTKDFVIADYCQFGYKYKKPTKILTNKKLENVRCKCIGKHEIKMGALGTQKTTLLERYSLPPKLLDYLLN